MPRVKLVCDCCGTSDVSDRMIQEIADSLEVDISTVHEAMFWGDGHNFEVYGHELVLKGCHAEPADETP